MGRRGAIETPRAQPSAVCRSSSRSAPRGESWRANIAFSGPLDLCAQAEAPSDEVGGQPLVTKGIQPPPPEPDGHVCVHPALQHRVLRMKAESPIRATSILVEPSACPPSSCPGHYPRRWATTGTLSPWALLPVGDPVVVGLVRSTFRASVHPLPLRIAGCVPRADA